MVAADAMFTHADFAAGVVAGGDYIVPVKGNQPQLLADVALAFRKPEGVSPRQRGRLEGDRWVAREIDKCLAAGSVGRWPPRRSHAATRAGPGWPRRSC